MQRIDLSARLGTALEQLNVPRGAAMVVGVSGGADSVALLHLLSGLNLAGWSLRLHAAHLNHQLRGAEADADAEFAAQLARSLRVPVSVESADVTARAQAEGVSIEQAGRTCRFEFFERVALQTGCELVALAHQADDQAETLLHRLVRGTGIRGLMGIRASRPIRVGSTIRIIRPMLSVRRGEIEQFLRDRNISFRVDSTNQASGYTRNVIRNEVLPLLAERLNPQVVESLLRVAEQAGDLEHYLDELGEKSLPPLILESRKDHLTLDCDALDRKPKVIRSYVLRQAIRRLGVPEGDVRYDHLMRTLALAGDRSGSKTLHLPGGLRVTRAYGRLKMFKAGSPEADPAPGTLPPTLRDADADHVAIEGTTLLPDKGLEFTTELFDHAPAGAGASVSVRHKKESEPGLYEEWLDADCVQPPLLARSRREGDRFRPLGMQDSKKVSDFMIDQKVAAEQRDRTVLLCDQAGPIWVVPFRIDERVRLRPETRRVLRVTVRPLQTEDHW